AEEASEAKSRFLANMSHEIRTPLNGILGLTEIMMGENVSDEHYQYLKMVRDSGKNLSKLINDILDFSKIESGNLQLEHIKFNFSEVIIASILPYKFLAEQKGLNLFYHIGKSIPHEVIGDPTRISQIVTNLIGNAIKFTEQGKVDVSFSLLQTEGGEITLQGVVKDTGVGIPKGVEEKIFRSFSQADESITRKFGGTGLGLSIVKNLLDQMSGGISIQSPAHAAENKGAAFVFTMKLGEPLAPARVALAPVDQARKIGMPFHVLIVDDNKVNLLVAKKMIQKFGAEVTTVESGPDAISLAKSNCYDMVLMDVQMPEMNGCEAALELRKLGFTKPIIALSANAYPEDIQNSLDAGMNDHLHKPYTEEQLFSKIMEFIQIEI
ncbi:MAG TPA: response regulator, partial [Cyclobacteriaceae bacterium]|nr:response regulator [Cyclobacteriaceae bacterium]